MDKGIQGQLETLNQQVKELSGLYHGAAWRLGISDSEFWVLYALAVLEGEYTQQDICDMWSLPKQTVNSVVASLGKRGHVRLEAVPGAHNRKIIRLTEGGRLYGKNAVARISEAEKRSIAGMSEQERNTCIGLLGKYITLLRSELDER